MWVVLDAPGYSLKYDKNIELVEYLKSPFTTYHMQTKYDNGYLSNGGRVLFLMNAAKTTKEAFKPIYDYLDKISNQTLYYRRDLANYVR